MSRSHLRIESYVISAMPGPSRPTREGWKSASGARNLRSDCERLGPPFERVQKNNPEKRVAHLSFPMVTMLPSGNSYDFSRADEFAAVLSSSSKSSAT